MLQNNWQTELDINPANDFGQQQQNQGNTSISNLKNKDGFTYDDVKGLSPKQFAIPNGNERLRLSIVAWRKEKKGMSQEQALNEIITGVVDYYYYLLLKNKKHYS